MTQDSDSGVLIQLVDDNLLDHFGCDWVTLAISRALGNNDDVQTLTSRTFLNELFTKALKVKHGKI